MKIVNEHSEKFNFRPGLQPLFDAMAEGKTITSITCCKGSMNWNNPTLDYEIPNFTANEYWVSIGWSGDQGYVDWVWESDDKQFYMSNVREFKI